MAKIQKPLPPGTPEYRVVKRPESDGTPRLAAGKEFWDAVIQDVTKLNEDEAIELDFDEHDFTSSMRSSARRAAARAGIKIRVSVRGTAVYIWALPAARDKD